METIGEIYKYIKGPDHVAKFQRFCGVEPRETHRNNGQVKNEFVSEANGDCADEANKIFENGIGHQNGYSKNLQLSLKKNGYSVNGSCQGGKNLTLTNGVKKEIAFVQNTNGYLKRKNDNLICNGNKQKPYTIKYKSLYYLFCFGASLGNELFYLTFFPFLLWNVDSRVARQMVIIWHWAMYIGQATKDIVKWPRPSTPPVFKLEDRYEQEYGMPSTHATVGAVIPFSVLIISSRYYEFPFIVGLVIAVLWTLLVCCSRIYLGMHTVLDILAGLLFAGIIVPVLLPFVRFLDEVQVTHPTAIFITLFGSFLLSFIYPTQYKWSTTKGDTANVHAISSGVTVGTWINYQLGIMSKSSILPPYQIISPTFHWMFCSISCLVIGTVLLGGIRAIVKPLGLSLICFLYKIDKKDIAAQRRHGVEVPLRFLTYHSVSIGATFLAPIIFNWMGIMRQSFYSEV